MKITWFAETCFRLHVGGKIVVVDPEAAPEGVDAQELVSGADRVLQLGQADLPAFDTQTFRPRRRRSLIDAPEDDELGIWSFGKSGLAIAASDEPLVIIAPYVLAQWGRFADDALVVFCANAVADAKPFAVLVAGARPRLVALAAVNIADTAFPDITALGGGTPIQVLDKAMALEV